jgi:hypothetical protein
MQLSTPNTFALSSQSFLQAGPSVHLKRDLKTGIEARSLAEKIKEVGLFGSITHLSAQVIVLR